MKTLPPEPTRTESFEQDLPYSSLIQLFESETKKQKTPVEPTNPSSNQPPESFSMLSKKRRKKMEAKKKREQNFELSSTTPELSTTTLEPIVNSQLTFSPIVNPQQTSAPTMNSQEIFAPTVNSQLKSAPMITTSIDDIFSELLPVTKKIKLSSKQAMKTLEDNVPPSKLPLVSVTAQSKKKKKKKKKLTK